MRSCHASRLCRLICSMLPAAKLNNPAAVAEPTAVLNMQVCKATMASSNGNSGNNIQRVRTPAVCITAAMNDHGPDRCSRSYGSNSGSSCFTLGWGLTAPGYVQVVVRTTPR